MADPATTPTLPPTNSGSGKKAAKLEAPDGFDTNVGRKMGDGWVKKGKGVVVQGRLLGHHKMKAVGSDGKARSFFQFELQHTIVANKTLGEDDEGYNEDDEDANRIDVTLNPGQVLNVDMSVALRDLEPYTRDGGTYDVWFAYTEQDPKFRNMWRINGPKLRIIKPAKHQVSALKDGDIPF